MSREAAVWRRPSVLIPLGLFAFALLVRLIGVDWHGQHPDEDIGGPARLLAGDLHPHSFYYPPLLTYLVAIAYVPLFAIGRLLGWWHSAADFRAAYFGQSTIFFVTARIIVAGCSATVAPIAWALARQLRIDDRAALLVGSAAALLPGSIFWAHIAKSDSGLGPAFLLVALLALRLLDRPAAGRAILLGAGIALAVSFKQSAVFFLAPLLTIVALASLRAPATRVTMLKAWSIALIATLAIGAVLNAGVLLDPRPYLAAQVVQSQMSFRAASLASTAAIWLQGLTSGETGLPAPVLLALAATIAAALIAPGAPRRRFALAALAIAWIVGTAAIGRIAGSRQPSHLWLPYMIVLGVAGACAAAVLAERPERPLRIAGAAMLALLFVGEIARDIPILVQATRPSIGARVAAAVRAAAAPGARIASGVDLSQDLPLAPASMTLARARHERLARRYGIVLPPPERPLTGTPGGYVVIGYPFVIGGLETYRADEVKVILPYAWPMQPDEWRLESWRAQGFHLFVVSGAAALLASSIPEYRAFFRAIDRCPRLATLPTERPLYFEEDARLYRCP